MVASGHKRSLGASKRRVNATKVEELSSSPSKSEVPFFFFTLTILVLILN